MPLSSSLLSIVQQFCLRTALTIPSSVMSSQDEQLLQIVGLLNEVLDSLATTSSQWSFLQKEVTFTSVAGSSQGDLSLIAPGFQSIINETLYDRTRRLPIFGPRGAVYWQEQKALPFTGPYYNYRLSGSELLILPEMPAGHTIAFEYYSPSSVKDSTVLLPSPYKKWFTKDDDTCLFPDNLLLAGLKYAWKREKGFSYDAEFIAYNTLIQHLVSSDGTKPRLSLDHGMNTTITPGIFIPTGNWPLSS